MTPDEAMRHEWLTSSSSSHMSSSSSTMTSSLTGSGALTGSVVEASQPVHAQTALSCGATSVSATVGVVQSVSSTAARRRAETMEDPQQKYALYHLYRGRKCISKITALDAPDATGLVVKSKLNGSASSHALTSGTQPASSRHASTGDIVTSLDPSLDDSGTFLPHILS